MRALHPEAKPRILVSDTVGFIKKLPHDLVASFKSTLDEALEASLLLHIVDASDPSREPAMALRDDDDRDVTRARLLERGDERALQVRERAGAVRREDEAADADADGAADGAARMSDRA